MTPEERVEYLGNTAFVGWDDCCKAIIEEINAAIAAEREACAKEAEAPRIQDAMKGVVCTSRDGHEIAAVIRNRIFRSVSSSGRTPGRNPGKRVDNVGD